MQEWIRIWQEQDVGQITAQLLMVGDLKSDCANCRQLGLDCATAVSCPSCHVIFKYVTSRHAGGIQEGRMGIVKRIKAKRQDLIFIDYDDYKKIIGRIKAKDFFK